MQQIHRRVVDFFSALSDETRLKILGSLMEKDKTVGDIHKSVGDKKLTLSAISHQLKHLYLLGIIVYEKKGREKYFHLSDKFCWCMLKDAFKHFK